MLLSGSPYSNYDHLLLPSPSSHGKLLHLHHYEQTQYGTLSRNRVGPKITLIEIFDACEKPIRGISIFGETEHLSRDMVALWKRIVVY
jgi:hypothetical protein